MTQTPIRAEETQQLAIMNTTTTTIFPPELVDQPTPTRTFTEILETYTSSCQPAAFTAFTAFTDINPTVSNVPAPAPIPTASASSLTPLTDLVSASHQPDQPDPSVIHQNNSTPFTAQPVSWLWQQRIPLAGITLLDGDHRLGKSLLSLQIAAAVSSGKPMPDGSPTIRGGVIIVTPFTDPNTTQRQQLIDLGADLDRIEILSFVPNTNPQLPQNPSFPPSDTRIFSLPEDLTHLFAAIERVDARLIIFDPFIHLLSRHYRYTKQRLSDLLTDLNHFLIEHTIACLLLRNCRAKGGHAKPTPLEKSDHFPTTAVSHLLLAPDPMQPKQILLSHALSRHSDLTPTLTLHIQSLPTNPNLAHITIHGHHILQADQLLAYRPDTLHRQLLAQLILPIIANSTEPVPATTLYSHFPNSSIPQVQRALKDLLNNGHIERPTRGFYTTRQKLDSPTATTSPSKLNHPAATTSSPKLNHPAAITTSLPNLDQPAAITSLPNLNKTTTKTTKLDASATTTPSSKFNQSAAITSSPKLDASAATTSSPSKLNSPAAITTKLDAPATTTPPSKLNSPAATTSNPKPPRPHKNAHKQNKPHGRPGHAKKKH
jgi:hypothetical protein